jgi:hypothetical protein
MAGSRALWATVDRIEEDERGEKIAVLLFDDGQQLHLPARLLPQGSGPQQLLEVAFQVDPKETARRAAEIRRRQQQLFGD